MKLQGWMSLLVLVGGWVVGQAEAQLEVYPAAILPFQERGAGVKDYGQKISDILFAKLAIRPELMLVERAELQKLLEEHELNLSGAVTPGQATQVGQLTGAKLLISGSVIEADSTLYLVAKIIGTETSRVLGESVEGKMNDELGPLVTLLATKVADTIIKQSDKLVAKPVKHEDRVAALKAKLGDGKRPLLGVRVTEHHVGQATVDPAAQTELVLFARETGFEVVDPKVGGQKVNIAIEGEGFSEFALRRGNLVSVKARLEVKAIDRATDQVIAIDRQTAVVVDLTEQLAGKAALQEAAAQIAERMLPKLVK